MTYSDTEKAVYIEMIEWLAALMALQHGVTQYGKVDPITNPALYNDIKGALIDHHQWMSTWVAICNVLWKADVIFPEGDKRPYANDENYPARFEAHLNIDQIAPALMAGAWETYAPTADVLYELMECAYIGLDKTPHFKSSAKPFPVSSTFQSIFSKLAECGYTIKEDGLYRYTDKVGKAFKQRSLWSYDTHAEQLAAEIKWKEEHDQELKLMYETMPEEMKEFFFIECPDNSLGLADIISKKWDNEKGKWVPKNKYEDSLVMCLMTANEFLETYGPIYREK